MSIGKEIDYEIRKPTTDDFFKEGDRLVYEVHYDDNEPYVGWDQTVGIFASWDEAVNYINDVDPDTTITYECNWGYPSNVLRFNHGKYDRVRYPVWNVVEEFYRPFYTIMIYNLRTGKQVPFDNVHIFLKEDWEANEEIKRNDKTDISEK